MIGRLKLIASNIKSIASFHPNMMQLKKDKSAFSYFSECFKTRYQTIGFRNKII